MKVCKVIHRYHWVKQKIKNMKSKSLLQEYVSVYKNKMSYFKGAYNILMIRVIEE